MGLLIIYQRIKLNGIFLPTIRTIMPLCYTDEDELVCFCPSFHLIGIVNVRCANHFFPRGITQASEVQLIDSLKRMVVHQTIHRLIVRKADKVLSVQGICRKIRYRIRKFYRGTEKVPLAFFKNICYNYGNLNLPKEQL